MRRTSANPSDRFLPISGDREEAGTVSEPAVEDTARQCEALGHRVEVAPLPLAKREFTEAFVLYWASGAARVVPPFPSGPGIVGPLLTLVRHSHADSDWVRYLLFDVLVVLRGKPPQRRRLPKIA